MSRERKPSKIRKVKLTPAERRAALEQVDKSAPRAPSEVFISYAHQDRQIARKLARFLQSRGIRVWWDYKLFAGKAFHAEILAQLLAARSVIVIWSAHSAVSEFVLDEAARAQRADKLVTTHVAGFDFTELPIGFGRRHTVCVDQRLRLIEALAEHGVSARTASRAA